MESKCVSKDYKGKKKNTVKIEGAKNAEAAHKFIESSVNNS